MLKRGTYPEQQPEPTCAHRILTRRAPLAAGQGGATIVEALVTASIVAGLSLSIATVVNFANKASMTAVTTTDFNSVMASINTIIGSDEYCAGLLATNYAGPPAYSNSFDPTPASVKSIDALFLKNGSLFIRTGMTGSLRISSISLINNLPQPNFPKVLSATSSQFPVTLRIVQDTGMGPNGTVKAVGVTERESNIPMLVTVNTSTNTITGCSSSAAATAVWERSAPDVFLKNLTDRVAIGTAAPQGLLHLHRPSVYDWNDFLRISDGFNPAWFRIWSDGSNYGGEAYHYTMQFDGESRFQKTYIGYGTNTYYGNGIWDQLTIGTGNYGSPGDGIAVRLKFAQSANDLRLASVMNSSTGSDFVVQKIATSGGAVGELMRATSAGNVGIGTAGPARKLHVMGSALLGESTPPAAGSGNSSVLIETGPGIAGPQITLTGDPANSYYSGIIISSVQGIGRLHQYGPGGFAGLWLSSHTDPNSSALVGVAKNGGAWISNSPLGQPSLIIRGSTSTSTETSLAVKDVADAPLLTVKNNATVGIGTASPGYNLDVVGTINASGAVSSAGVALTSDARFKRDVAYLSGEGALARIEDLQPVSFYWDPEKFPSGKAPDSRRHLGFLAQDIEKIWPELVDSSNPEMKRVSLVELISPLTQAVKELAKWLRGVAGEVADLASRVVHLERENSELKAEIADLKAAICESNPKARACAR